MPELPEAEIVARQIRDRLVGATVRVLWIGREDIVRHGFSTRHWYPESIVTAVERRGKSVVLTFSKEGTCRYMVAELGMTGLLLFGWAGPAYDKHTHVRLVFDGGLEPELRYWNPRRFGRVYFFDAEGLASFTARRFGHDPLSMTWEMFRSLVRGRRGRVKALLMRQQDLAGIGNIYANEILFRARLHPHRSAARVSVARTRELYRQIQIVLSDAIDFGGSSIRDFLAPDGTPGRYTTCHLVYNHARKPCPGNCGAIIRVLKGERTSFYCPRCQRR